MSLKSKFAFEFSLQEMEETLYFWTFTFAKPHTYEMCAKAWNNFYAMRHGLRDCFPHAQGLRVFEEHPGKGEFSHGWHIHAVFNKRLPIEIVRRVAEEKGIGRLNVKKVPREAAGYLAKYLAKKRKGYAMGKRLWAALGNMDYCRVRDIEVRSQFTETRKMICRTVHGFKSLDWCSQTEIVNHVMAGQDILSSVRNACTNDRYDTEDEELWWDSVFNHEEEMGGANQEHFV